MVKEIKANGRLKLTQTRRVCLEYRRRRRGNGLPGARGSGCARVGAAVDKASAHVFGRQVSEAKRDEETMEVRLDARTTNADETRQLGIEVGDFVAFDPRVEVTNGFIRSRHLDDKACVACIVAAVKALHDAGLQPVEDTYLLISNYEEVGHGAATGFPPEMAELVAVDMAAMGTGRLRTSSTPRCA